MADDAAVGEIEVQVRIVVMARLPNPQLRARDWATVDSDGACSMRDGSHDPSRAALTFGPADVKVLAALASVLPELGQLRDQVAELMHLRLLSRLQLQATVAQVRAAPTVPVGQ